MKGRILTSLQDLPGLASPPEPTESGPSPCASATPSAKPSSPKRGRESRSGGMCERSVWPTPRADNIQSTRTEGGNPVKDGLSLSQVIKEGSGFSQPAFPASQPHGPGSSEARRMTAGSGLTLSMYFRASDPLGRFSRILLASETWASPEFYLNWKVKATRCGCSVFQLAPSAPRTGESDTGLFAAGWGTPNCMDEIGPRSQEALARAKKKAGCCNIKDQLPQVWPTTSQGDWKSPTPNPAKHGQSVPPASEHNLTNRLYHAGNVSYGCLARTEKFVERLTTLSAWLMGYTGAYLAHWATASSRRSPKSSSKP